MAVVQKIWVPAKVTGEINHDHETADHSHHEIIIHPNEEVSPNVSMSNFSLIRSSKEDCNEAGAMHGVCFILDNRAKNCFYVKSDAT